MTPASCERARAENLDRGTLAGAIVEPLPERASSATGALAGVSLALKDMVDLRGRPPGLGLGAPSQTVPEHNAKLVDVLLGAGMDLAAITEMTPLAFEPSGGNPWRGRPRNPHNTAYICGGSSSGSAVAVAVGSVRVAVGSDTAGSLRIPAHCCGVTAWKPTYGIVPTIGTMALAPSLDTIGFLVRSAADLAPVASLFTEDSKRILSVGVAVDLFEQSAAATKSAMTAVMPALTGAGARTEAVDLSGLLAACDGDVLTLLQGEAARATAAISSQRALDPTLSKRLSKGLAVTDDMQRAAHARLRRVALDAATTLFAKVDAVILPVMPILVPRVAACEPGDPAFSARTLYQLSAFTRFVNGLGWPAVAMPVGFDADGLPIGYQLVGPPGSDIALLGLAARYQRTTTWHLNTTMAHTESSTTS